MKRLSHFASAGARALTLLTVLASATAFAHKPSDSYLTVLVHPQQLDLRWDIALRDLDHAIHLDGNGDGLITWAEVQHAEPTLAPMLSSALQLSGCTPGEWSWLITRHSDGNYLVANSPWHCSGPVERLSVHYGLFFAIDPLHRGILHAERDGQAQTFIFSEANRDATLDLAAASPWGHFSRTVATGVEHIWSGLDHLLFLFALLLPSVLRREGSKWVGQPGLAPSLKDVFKIVTAFTLAHSLSLSLSAFGLVALPSRFVESAIAASIVIAALNNLYPVLRNQRWSAAFCLGILHGFAFSSTLRDLALPTANRLVTLFGFNLGVELGQLATVVVFVPLAYLLRETTAYRRVIFIGGSVATLLLAIIWLTERAMNLRILPV